MDYWKRKSTYVTHWEQAEFENLAKTLEQQGEKSEAEQYTSTLPTQGVFLHFVPFLQGMLY